MSLVYNKVWKKKIYCLQPLAKYFCLSSFFCGWWSPIDLPHKIEKPLGQTLVKIGLVLILELKVLNS